MRNLFGFRYFYFGLVALTFIVMLSSSVDATLFTNRCFLLANGTPCIQWDGSKFILTNITVNGTGATYTAQAPWLFLSGTTFNFNTTKANIDYNNTLYCDAGLSLKANNSQLSSYALMNNLSAYYLNSNPRLFINQTFTDSLYYNKSNPQAFINISSLGALNYAQPYNASCNGNEVLREVFLGNSSNYKYCVNVSATGGADGTGGWINTSSLTSTNLNVSIQGKLNVLGSNNGVDINFTTLDLNNNYAIRSTNSTGGIESGVWLDTNNCWHFGWSVVDCRI